MTKEKLIDMIAEGSDIMIFVMGKNFTILTWPDEGIAIGEQSPNDNALQYFETPEQLVESFMIDGIILGEIAESVKITQYT